MAPWSGHVGSGIGIANDPLYPPPWPDGYVCWVLFGECFVMRLVVSQLIIASFCYSEINPAWNPELPVWAWWAFIGSCACIIVGEVFLAGAEL